MNDKKSDRDILVDMYILNKLSDSERIEFEFKMQSDKELAQEVALMQAVVESLRQQEEMRQKMQVWKESASALSDATVSQKVHRIKWVKMVSAIAACALLLIGLSYSCSYNALQDGDFYDLPLRGDLGQIVGFLENEQYPEALDFISVETQYREACLNGSQELSPGKKEYYESELQYLQWAKIQALLRMKKYDQAKEELALFRSDAGMYKRKADWLYLRLKIRTLL